MNLKLDEIKKKKTRGEVKMPDYNMFVCTICNKLGQISRGVIVPNIVNPKENTIVHKRCEKEVYKQLSKRVTK